MRGEVKRVLFECAEGHQWRPKYYSIGGKRLERGIEWADGQDICPECCPAGNHDVQYLRRWIESEIESLEAQAESAFVHWCGARALHQEFGAKVAKDAQDNVSAQLGALRRVLERLQ